MKPIADERAPSGGRALRLVLGVAILAYVTPVYLRVDRLLALRVVLLMVGLLGVYSLLHFVASRGVVAPGPGAVVANGLLLCVYLLGGSGAPLLGRGAGRLAAVSFLGVSLLVAGLRGDPGCEVMALPGALFRKRIDLKCLIFSPLDSLERKLRSKSAP